jgi:hypothetical protein
VNVNTSNSNWYHTGVGTCSFVIIHLYLTRPIIIYNDGLPKGERTPAWTGFETKNKGISDKTHITTRETPEHCKKRETQDNHIAWQEHMTKAACYRSNAT